DTSSTVLRRVRQVKTRSLVHFDDSRELIQIMIDVLKAHKRLFDDADILHGDINPNTIVIFEFDNGKGKNSAGEGDGDRPVGAIVDFDEPVK
ncbi:hypothetical protein C8Q77DRAFT_1026844, partial [Trametes polyzona]